MPNWCHTILEVTGEEPFVREFVAGFSHSKDDYGSKVSIIEGWFPTPEELVNTVSTFGKAHDEAHEKQMEENLAKYGAKDWYDWNIENWGTKWSDCHTMVDDIEVLDDGSAFLRAEYDTAWGTATAAFVRISQTFPTLTFRFRHDEEAGFFAGSEVVKNGELLFEKFFAPCEYEADLGEPDWDSDEWTEKYDKWKYEKMDDIDNEADVVVMAV